MSERQYYLTDYESGERIPVSKETWEAYNAWMRRLWADATPKLQAVYKGRPIVVGTAGGFDKQGDLQELFTAPSGYVVGIDPYWQEGNEPGKVEVFFYPAYDQSFDEYGNPKKP